MFRPVVLALAGGLALAGCGGHDKAGGARAPDGRTIEIAIRDGSARLLTSYASAVVHDASAPTKITVRKGWRADARDAESRTIADVRAGRVAFAAVPARVLDRLGVDAFTPLLAPLAIDSLQTEQRVLASAIPDRALPTLRRLGVVGVAVLPGDLRHPLGLTRPLVRPQDYAGAYLGVRDSALESRTFRQLGAAVAPIAGEDFAGFDGIESDLAAIESDRADVGAASLVPDLALWPRILVVVANPRAWERIGPARRKALHAAGRDALGPAIAALRTRDADAYAILCRRGEVPFARSPAVAMRRALAPAASGLDPATVAAIARLRAPRTRHPPCRPAGRSRAGRATPVDGVWTFEIDAADLRRVHTPRDDVGGQPHRHGGHHELVGDEDACVVEPDHSGSEHATHGHRRQCRRSRSPALHAAGAHPPPAGGSRRPRTAQSSAPARRRRAPPGPRSTRPPRSPIALGRSPARAGTRAEAG